MAKKKEEVKTSNNVRKWRTPKDRAKTYSDELKAKEHTNNPAKKGQKLTDFEAGIRSGYLQCQSDHAGAYKYKLARQDGYNKAEAKKISQCKQKYPTPFASDKG